jgi:hypothetical protein
LTKEEEFNVGKGGVRAAAHRLTTNLVGLQMSKYRFVLSMAMAVSLTVVASVKGAEAKTVKVKGSDQGTGLTSNFSFDGVAPALSITYTGKDNIGGTFNAHDVGEYSFTATSCTAPDGSTGTKFLLVQAAAVINYKDGQVYTSGTPAAGNSGCASNTTGSFGLTETATVIGGTGKFANASGSTTGTIANGQELATPGMPPGSLGQFSAFQSTYTGSVTF